MFVALKSIPAVESVVEPVVEPVVDPAVEAVVPTEPTVTLTEAAFDSLIDNLRDVPATRVARIEQRATQTEVGALITAIETFGLSRGLLSFANHNGVLRAAVPVIPALESLEADLSVDDSTAVLEALKAISFEPEALEEDEEPAEEASAKSTVVGVAAGAAILFLGGPIWAAVFAMSAFFQAVKGMEDWNDDKEGRLAKVVPFKIIVDSLEGIVKIATVAKELEDITLPKSAEEYAAFTKKVDGIAAPLSAVGVHVSDDAVTVVEFPKAVKGNIETIGYHEKALAEIAELTEKAKDALKGMKSLTYKALDAQLKAATKGEERKYAGEGYDLVGDTIHTAVLRAAKIFKLTKTTVGAIKHFYKKA